MLQRFDCEYKVLFKCFMEQSQFAGESNASLPIFSNAIFSNLFKLQCSLSTRGSLPHSISPIEIDLVDTQEEQVFSEREEEFPNERYGRLSLSPHKGYLKEERKVVRPHTSTGVKKEERREERKEMFHPLCDLSGIEVADLKAPPSAFMVHSTLSRRSLPKKP